MNLRSRILGITLAAAAVTVSLVHPAAAQNQKVNCANEFRSGKLYFSQKVWDKAVEHFRLAAETCPEKGEYRARYAIALAQYADIVMQDQLVQAATKEAEQAAVDTAVAMFQHAGAEFDSSLAQDDSKKNQKFVRESRQHYWVDHYNAGLKLAKDEKFEEAALQLRIARILNPSEVKAYQQGAVVLIKAGRKPEAAMLVETALQIDPQNQDLKDLRDEIYLDAARTLIDEMTNQSGPEAVAKSDSAIEYLHKVLAEKADTPDAVFLMGSANLEAGSAIARADTGDAAAVSPEAKARFLKAAEDFQKAAALVPAEGENSEFHANALFNRMQALLNAQDYQEAKAAIKDYLAISPTDPAAWTLMAQALIQAGEQDDAVTALSVSKGLQGTKLDPVSASPQKEEAEAFQSLGPPDAGYTFQEAGSGDQINVWFWTAKKSVTAYKLGLKVGTLTW